MAVWLYVIATCFLVIGVWLKSGLADASFAAGFQLLLLAFGLKWQEMCK